MVSDISRCEGADSAVSLTNWQITASDLIYCKKVKINIFIKIKLRSCSDNKAVVNNNKKKLS